VDIVVHSSQNEKPGDIDIYTLRSNDTRLYRPDLIFLVPNDDFCSRILVQLKLHDFTLLETSRLLRGGDVLGRIYQLSGGRLM
jgi:hypothetical protein